MTHPETLLQTLSYVKRLSGQTILVKLGGATLETEKLPSLCRDLQLLREVGIQVVVVHGGGPEINAELKSRGIPYEFIDGQWVPMSPMSVP